MSIEERLKAIKAVLLFLCFLNGAEVTMLLKLLGMVGG